MCCFGSGSFSVVKRAINKETSDIVAVKIVNKRNVKEATTLASEIEILRYELGFRRSGGGWVMTMMLLQVCATSEHCDLVRSLRR